MTIFPIQIDATKLVYRYFQILGIADTWTSSRTIQTLAFEPGIYEFQVGAGYYADFTFSVTPTGTVDYDTRFDAFLTGRGSSTLNIDGFEVTLDARYLSGSGILLGTPLTNEDWITYKTCRMVPASSYSVQQGAGVVTSFSFKLKLDGTFWYDQDRFGRFLAGNGTSTLAFLGYPILVDARAANGDGLTIQTIWQMPFTYTAVQFANLLPAPVFALQVNAGVVTEAVFSLGVEGNFSFIDSLSPYLELDTFNGLTLLKVKGPLPT